MKQIINMLRLDKSLIIREKIAVYIIVTPIVMSFLIITVLTAVESDNIHIAITGDVPQIIAERMSSYMEVEAMESIEALKKRINEFDNMAGAYWDGTALQVLFQGNEGSAYEASIRTAVDNAINTSLPNFTIANVATGRDFLTQMIIAVLLTAPAAIGGIISGFSIVTEKETLMSSAYRITPLSTGRYLMSRYITSIIVGFINLVGISLVLGVGAKLPLILLATVFALPMFAASPVLIGGVAKDKMGSISMIKVIMLLFICLPIAAGLTPENYQFFYYPFPMYWHYKTIESVLQNNINFMYGAITFVISGAVLVVLVLIFGKKLQKS